jgi:lipid-binding SYLF domain-containing protein
MLKVLLSAFLMASAGSAAFASETLKDVENRVQKAAQIFDEIMAANDSAIPDSLLKNAQCVAVIPSVVKVGFFVGGSKGSGLVSCRTLTGWSRPLFIDLASGSVGFQFGAKKTDVILTFMRRDAARFFERSNFTLGGDISVAAGPLGRSAEAGVDYKLTSEIYSYSRSRGAFLGVSLKGTSINRDDSANLLVYGPVRSMDSILFRADEIPLVARVFVDTLARYSP